MSSISRALIRTHHITSRKKIVRLKSAAKALNVNCLIRSGGVPGVMFVEGEETNVKDWVNVVHGLRYKDYQLVVGPESGIDVSGDGKGEEAKCEDQNGSETGKGKKMANLGELGELREVESVKDMGAIMDSKGLRNWWRVGMGFAKGE